MQADLRSVNVKRRGRKPPRQVEAGEDREKDLVDDKGGLRPRMTSLRVLIDSCSISPICRPMKSVPDSKSLPRTPLLRPFFTHSILPIRRRHSTA